MIGNICFKIFREKTHSLVYGVELYSLGDNLLTCLSTTRLAFGEGGENRGGVLGLGLSPVVLTPSLPDQRPTRKTRVKQEVGVERVFCRLSPFLLPIVGSVVSPVLILGAVRSLLLPASLTSCARSVDLRVVRFTVSIPDRFRRQMGTEAATSGGSCRVWGEAGPRPYAYPRRITTSDGFSPLYLTRGPNPLGL